MPFERPITIEEAIKSVQKREYLLPAIQREFVWTAEKIETLFDSLMRNYPIGTFLLWFVEKQNSKNFQFYEFIKNYHENKNFHNPKAEVVGGSDLIAVLDGQQRLTALYLGLKGSYADKVKGKRWDNPEAFPERKLYLNLLSQSEEQSCEYDFKFLTDEDAEYRDPKTFWFKVGDILTFDKEVEVAQYPIRKKIGGNDPEKAEFAVSTLFKLYTVIRKDPVIHYFMEKDEKLEKVLNIFIRVNSGGTPLSYSDLLLSIATAQWAKRDAREEITQFVDEVCKVGSGFDIDKDFVLKTCLVLSDLPDFRFKVDNFNKENMLKIEDSWEDITSAIRTAFTFASINGFNRDTLPSNFTLIPIAYYLLKNRLSYEFLTSSRYKGEREKMHMWLIFSLLKRTFSGQPDSVLRPIRQVIADDHSSFPLIQLTDKLRATPKSIVFNEDDIVNLFNNKYGGMHTFATLALLYPTLDFKNKFHQDHIFPRSAFTMKNLVKQRFDRYKCEFYLENFDYIANLQLIEGTPNQEKSNMDFKAWIAKTYPQKSSQKEYMEKHYIPDVDLEFDNFEEFIKQRTILMKEKFKSILKMDK